MTSVGELLCILQNTLDGFVDGPAYKHAHETLIEVRRRFVSHNQRDQEQSARIAELEAEVAEWKHLLEKETAEHDAEEARLEAERDAARKALADIVAGWREEASIPAPHEMSNKMLLETCAREVEAALLAAAREGGAL